MRLEVGRGLEGVMTDATSHRIIEETMLPYFADDAYFRGILAGIDRMTPLLTGEIVALPESLADTF